MLAISTTKPQLGAACPGASSDPNALAKQLTSIKILGAQIIADDTAQGVSDALRCNVMDAATKAVAPAVVITTIAAIATILTAVIVAKR